jgi:hypothetical protein
MWSLGISSGDPMHARVSEQERRRKGSEEMHSPDHNASSHAQTPDTSYHRTEAFVKRRPGSEIKEAAWLGHAL